MTTSLLTRPVRVPTRLRPRLGPLTRRRFLGGTASSALLLGLSGCGDGNSDGDSASGSDGSARPTTGPSRVVALGQGPEADAVIALGIVPVGMSVALNDSGIYPWAAQALGSRQVELVQTTDSIPFEQVAALKPDLIVANTVYDFETLRGPLEKIAPVLGPATTADKETWQQTTQRVGEALGRADQARGLVTGTEALLTSVRDQHPDWAGRTFTVGPALPDGQVYVVNSRDDVAAVLLQQLGLALSPTVAALPESATPGRAVLSGEQITALDADVLLMIYFGEGAQAALEGNPLFQEIPAVQRGSYVVVDSDVGVGLGFPSVLAIPYCVDRITPQLEKALAAG